MGAEHNSVVGLALVDPSEGSELSPEEDSVTWCHPGLLQQEQLPGSGAGRDVRALTALPVGEAVGWDDGWFLAQ